MRCFPLVNVDCRYDFAVNEVKYFFTCLAYLRFCWVNQSVGRFVCEISKWSMHDFQTKTYTEHRTCFVELVSDRNKSVESFLHIFAAINLSALQNWRWIAIVLQNFSTKIRYSANSMKYGKNHGNLENIAVVVQRH